MTATSLLRRALPLLAITLVLSACYPLSYEPGTPRPTSCDPTDTAVNDGHTASFFANYTQPKGPLSQVDCQVVVALLNTAADYAAQFPTVAAVKAAGWIQVTVWTPGPGHPLRRPDPPLRPVRPPSGRTGSSTTARRRPPTSPA